MNMPTPFILPPLTPSFIRRVSTEEVCSLSQFKRVAEAELTLGKLQDESILLWIWAKALVAIGEESLERADFKRALTKFKLAREEGCSLSQFWLDYAKALLSLSQLTGETKPALRALKILEVKQLGSYEIGCAYKLLYELSGQEIFFEKSNKAFAEVSSGDEKNVLAWSALYLHSGLILNRKDRFEDGYNILCTDELSDDFKTSLTFVSLMARFHAALGGYREDIGLIQGALVIIEGVILEKGESIDLLLALGFVNLELGNYFSDEKYYALAVSKFKRVLASLSCGLSSFGSEVVKLEAQLVKDGAHRCALFGLYLAQSIWGWQQESMELVVKSLDAIVRLSELSPEQACYCNAWGEALIHLSLFNDVAEDPDAISLIRMATGRFAQAILLSKGQENLSWLANYGRACDDLGQLTGEEAEHEKASLFLSQVYEKDSEFNEISTDFAYNQFYLGELNGSHEHLRYAVALFELSLEKNPECCRSLIGIGRALLELAVECYEPHAPREREELLANAERHLAHACELGALPGHYLLACVYALSNLPDSAVHHLERADAMGAMHDMDYLLRDRRLDDLKEEPSFLEFVAIKMGQRG